MNLNRDMMRYIETDDLDGVKDCIDQGADPNASEGYYPIEKACIKGNLDIVNLLIPYATKQQINDAFILACIYKEFSIMEALLSNGADIHYRSDYPFIVSINRKLYSIVRYLIKKGVSVDTKNKVGIINASLLGDYNMVKLLIDNNADVNARSGEPLFMACSHGYIDVVKLLVYNGALPNIDHLFCALKNGHQNVVLYLIYKGIDYIPYAEIIYKMSVENGMLKVIQLLEKTITIPFDMEQSILVASKNGYLNVIKYLASKEIPIPKDAKKKTKNQKIIEFIDRLYFKKNEPINNDGRSRCYWCGNNTKSISTGFSIMNVCSFCGK